MWDFDEEEVIDNRELDMVPDEDHPRQWSPAHDPATAPIWRANRAKLVTYDAAKQVSKLMMKPPQRNAVVDPSSMVVHTSGACLDDGKQPNRAGWGVWFGPESKYNVSGIVNRDQPQTVSRGDVEALAKALTTIYAICDKDYSLNRIYIATGCESLFEAMTDSVYDWAEGRGSAENTPYAAFVDVLKTIHTFMEEKQYGDEGGIEVKFWPRPIDDDVGAAGLAIDASQTGVGI